ncbi:MAG: EpsI family protein [Planctomycetes bacterium]|nr:EpsI family protein [Planctomycetota bacterium]
MVASGVGHRAAFDYLNGQVTARPLPPGTLAKVPMRIGDWQGVDVPLDEAVVKATDADDHLSRNYTDGATGERVWFYVSYGVRARDLMPHRPDVCYPLNGWILQTQQTVDLPPEQTGADVLRCRVLEFSKGGMNAGTAVVVNYYLVDGRSCPDESLLRSRAWRGSGSIDYMAQVQVVASAPQGDSAAKAREAAERFAAASVGDLREILAAAASPQSE